MGVCHICNSEAQITRINFNLEFVECIRCSSYNLSKDAKSLNIPTEEKRIAISHWIRKKSENKEPINISHSILKILIEEAELPNPNEQVNNLIRWLGKNIKYYNETKKVSSKILASVIGVKDKKGILYVAGHLQDNNFLTFNTDYKLESDIKFQLTFKGWEKYEELKHPDIISGYAFMAMQYKDKEHNEIYKKYFKKAVKQTGFELRRLDEVLTAGLIDNQLRVEIMNCQFLLADLTNDNNGAYWEAGFAEGLGKPVIYLCEKKHFDNFKTHFDTSHHTTIIWEKDKIELAMKNLKATIRATLPIKAKLTDN